MYGKKLLNSAAVKILLEVYNKDLRLLRYALNRIYGCSNKYLNTFKSSTTEIDNSNGGDT